MPNGNIIPISRQHYVEADEVFIHSMDVDDSEATAQNIIDNWEEEASCDCWGGVLNNRFKGLEVYFYDVKENTTYNITNAQFNKYNDQIVITVE